MCDVKRVRRQKKIRDIDNVAAAAHQPQPSVLIHPNQPSSSLSPISHPFTTATRQSSRARCTSHVCLRFAQPDDDVCSSPVCFAPRSRGESRWKPKVYRIRNHTQSSNQSPEINNYIIANSSICGSGGVLVAPVDDCTPF